MPKIATTCLSGLVAPKRRMAEHIDTSAAKKLLEDTKVSVLIHDQKHRHSIILKDSATVNDALKEMSAAKILSCPVVNPRTPDGPAIGFGPRWPDDQVACDIAGFVDIRDILSNFLGEIKWEELAGMNMMQKMRAIEDKGANFASKVLRDLDTLGVDGDFILAASQGNQNLLDFMNGLLNPSFSLEESTSMSHVVHRVAVFDNKGRISAIISQSDVIRYLDKNVSKLGALSRATVDELGWVTGKVMTTTPETSAIEALAKMTSEKISSMAVVDPAGKMVGNFSMSEMRTIVAEQFGALALPVADYIALGNKTEYLHNRGHMEEIEGTQGFKFVVGRVSRKKLGVDTAGADVGQELVHVKPNTQLSAVLSMMAQKKIHRVYILDDEQVPVGIITCTDVLRKLVSDL